MRKGILLVITMGLLSSLFGCRGAIEDFGEKGSNGKGMRAKTNESGLKRFSYSYDGTIGGNNFRYTIEEENGTVTFTYESMEYYDYGEMSMEVKAEVLDQLYELYKERNIARWDGYSKYNPDVCDGDGFSLSMSFCDGERMSADGSNCYPEGYSEFVKEMQKILTPYAEQLKEEARQEKISKGMKGDIDSIMANFIQHGDSGRDEYHILIMSDRFRDSNFDVQIKSRSGEFFPEGEYRYYAHVDDKFVDFAGVKDIYEKYDLINWYNYDESAEDYNNEEWFQINFSFEDDSLNAMGTEHPEHYDEFRKEMLEWLARQIDNAKENAGLKLYE